MQETQTTPAPAPNFASLLSSFTSHPPTTADSWDLSNLAADVATISYERALQAQARTKPFTPAVSGSKHANRAKDSAPRATIVTLRLSHAESNQLHERAAEAGLTVSAYLRSCVFEVDGLRAQVREALAQLRSAASPSPHLTRKPAQAASQTWRSRLFPRWSRSDRAAGL